ncbi:hypothetical protein [Parabacteroides sp. ZJ-118]|uniref:hypothetical protein n=1 Tax=Parabacteroides sp. ZJ-118 TaxID=2709398 RepID=UPI0013EA6447|nr:hypothetical protein [Parabacteroides sp. ZJ-118]
MLTLEEQYNRRRTPVVKRPELANTPLVEPEIAGSQNPVAVQDAKTDAATHNAVVGDEPQLNDYQWTQRLYDTLIQKPMSQEEEERRKRAASVATGIGHLGNVLSSFANLAFAGEAPSQKIPTVADPQLRSFSDRLMAERQKYASGKLAAANNDYNNYQRALQLYRQDQYRKDQYDLARAKLMQDAAQSAIKNDREDRKLMQEADYKKKDLAIKQANLYSLKKYREAKANGSSGSDKSIDIIGENGRRFHLSGKDKEGIIAYMYKRMLEYAEKHPNEVEISDIGWALGEGGDQKTKQAAIVMSNIQNFPELYDDFDKVIAGIPFKESDVDVEDYHPPMAPQTESDDNVIKWKPPTLPDNKKK